MWQPIRAVARAYHTLVGGTLWLPASLTSPSTGESTQKSGDCGSASGTPTPDGECEDGTRRPVVPDGGTRADGNTLADGDTPADSGTRVDGSGRADDASLDPATRIRDALAANDGRLEQREIADVTDLSQSTVSRRLIAMEDAGDVARYEIGRGKTVFLPDAVPAAFGSPTEGNDSHPTMAP